jgi:2-amino-4-hydroxy-6-hydroxymethyldihydropteridine diphosphokinase
MTHTIYLSLGSNLADRAANLQSAQDHLPPQVGLIEASPIYETEPWGYTDQPLFLNQALKAVTSLTPGQLLIYLKSIEKALGRLPSFHLGPRLIDLDILFFDDLVMHEQGLTIPHPYLHERPFVLVPLADVAPDFVHPVFHLTIKDFLSKLDTRGIRIYDPAHS